MDEQYQSDLFQSCVLLGVKLDSPVSEIKRRFRALAKKWHPDTTKGDRFHRRDAEERIRAINRAYRTLMTARRTYAALSEARATTPGYDSFGWRRGVSESLAGPNNDGEVSLYTRALELHFRGTQEFHSGRYRDAVSSLMQSVCLVQNNAEGYRILARSHRRLNQSAKAVAVLRTRCPNRARFCRDTLRAGRIAGRYRRSDRRATTSGVPRITGHGARDAIASLD
jgi:curved DNA-binding protein CbpA